MKAKQYATVNNLCVQLDAEGMALTEKKPQDGATAVYEGILEAVSRQRLAPGKRLPEESLADLFGVSRAQVRTALARLQRRGLVQMEPNRTTQVAQPSTQDVKSLFAVRSWIEPEIAAEVARAPLEGGLERLKTHLEKEQAARDADDRIEATRLSGLFHSEIADLSANAIARDYIHELVDRSFLAIYLYQRTGEIMCRNDEHFELYDAIRSGSPEKSRTLMQSHLDHILDRLDLFEQSDGSDDLSLAFRGILPVRE